MNDRRRPRHFLLLLIAAACWVLWAPAVSADGSLTFTVGGHAMVSHAGPVHRAHVAHRPPVATHYIAYAAPPVQSHFVAYAAPGVVTQSVSHVAPIETHVVWVGQRSRADAYSHRAVRRTHRPRGHAHDAGCGHSGYQGRRWHH